MNYQDTLDQLNITLGDSSDTTFNPEEKGRAMQKAWADPYVVTIVWDSSLTYSDTSYQYTVPNTLTTVKDVYISASNSTSDKPEKINSDLWEVVGANLQFKAQANAIIPNGYTLYLKGNKTYNYLTDTLPTTNLQEYVIALAGYNTLTLLTYKKANLFIKNDTTMSELIGLRRELKTEVSEYRSKLPREFENA